MSTEQVAGVGYMNEREKHVLVSIHNPSLLNPRPDLMQFAVTIDTAIELRSHLNAFLKQHGVQEH